MNTLVEQLGMTKEQGTRESKARAYSVELQGTRRYGVVLAKSAKGQDEATVYLYDTIVGTELEAEYFGGVAAERFVRDFIAIEASTIHLRINSPGGDVFAARAMEQAIVNSGSNVIAHIDGYAASSASFLALAADEVEISEGGFIMIHKSWAMAAGNADYIREMASLLDQIDKTLVASYAKRTGLKPAVLMEMLVAETWLGAEEAVAKGFADRIAVPHEVDAKTAYKLSAQAASHRVLNMGRERAVRLQKLYEMTASWT